MFISVSTLNPQRERFKQNLQSEPWTYVRCQASFMSSPSSLNRITTLAFSRTSYICKFLVWNCFSVTAKRNRKEDDLRRFFSVLCAKHCLPIQTGSLGVWHPLGLLGRVCAWTHFSGFRTVWRQTEHRRIQNEYVSLCRVSGGKGLFTPGLFCVVRCFCTLEFTAMALVWKSV